jgi:prepilin-type N-terminal cleavage/methylation domain-containing protein
LGWHVIASQVGFARAFSPQEQNRRAKMPAARRSESKDDFAEPCLMDASAPERVPPMVRNRSRAFTLIELMMVIAILGLLMALLMKAMQQTRESARRVQCLQRISEVGKAIAFFESEHNHYPGWRHYPFGATDSETGRPVKFSTSWFPQLLPYVGREDIFRAGRPGHWKSPVIEGGEPRGFAPNLPSLVLCPSDFDKMTSSAAEMSFVVNSGRRDGQATASVPADWRANGVFLDLVDWRGTPQDRVLTMTNDSSFIRQGDGLATTLLLSENVDAGRWYTISESRSTFIFYPPGAKPQHHINSPTVRRSRPSFLNARPSSRHPGGVNVVFAAGNGRFLDEKIDYAVYCALMTPKGSAAMEPGSTQPSADSITHPPPLPAELQ